MISLGIIKYQCLQLSIAVCNNTSASKSNAQYLICVHACITIRSGVIAHAALDKVNQHTHTHVMLCGTHYQVEI